MLLDVHQEYEVVAGTGGSEDCGSGDGVAVRHGHVSSGPVVGLVQVHLALQTARQLGICIVQVVTTVMLR